MGKGSDFATYLRDRQPISMVHATSTMSTYKLNLLCTRHSPKLSSRNLALWCSYSNSHPNIPPPPRSKSRDARYCYFGHVSDFGLYSDFRLKSNFGLNSDFGLN